MTQIAEMNELFSPAALASQVLYLSCSDYLSGHFSNIQYLTWLHYSLPTSPLMQLQCYKAMLKNIYSEFVDCQMLGKRENQNVESLPSSVFMFGQSYGDKSE